MSLNNILNKNVIDELHVIMGDDITLLFETYISDSEDKIQLLEQGINDLDFSLLRHTAHSLKGSSKNIGADEFAKNCGVLESLALDKELSECIKILPLLNDSFYETKKAIQDMV